MKRCGECVFRNEKNIGGHGMGDFVLYECRLGFNFIKKSFQDGCSPEKCPLHPLKYKKIIEHIKTKSKQKNDFIYTSKEGDYN